MRTGIASMGIAVIVALGRLDIWFLKEKGGEIKGSKDGKNKVCKGV